jgi:AcrR family transcriptional regulator
MVTKRDPEGTRRRILAAALEEFATVGLAGARVDRIAAAAQVNKRMLYHYFGSKEGLYAALLESRFRRLEETALAATALGHAEFSAADAADARLVRLLMWEALEGGMEPVVREAERAVAWRRLVGRVGDTAGTSAVLPSADLVLVLVAVRLFPRAFPQLARMIAGAPLDDAASDALCATLLKSLARPPAKPRYRLEPRVT